MKHRHRRRGQNVEVVGENGDFGDTFPFPVDLVGLFEKKQDLSLPSDSFELPPTAGIFEQTKWIIDEMMTMKSELNATKNLLDHLELNSWHRHTNEMNPSGMISSRVKHKYNPEYCSQAWCKLTECLFTYDVLPETMKDAHKEGHLSFIDSLHLCEAPGAFVSATNHYLRTKFTNVQWRWLGMSLNPHHEGNSVSEMINEDKLILHSLKNWDFLKDNTGNLISQPNISDFLTRHKETNYIFHIVTADGSIDCQNNPGEQEAAVMKLQFTEIVTALLSLIKGGSFVLKIFTFLECRTICHLYLLSCTFKSVHLFKPATSKEGNSEVYVVCTDFLGISLIEAHLSCLLNYVGVDNEEEALYPLECIDPLFISRIKQAAKFFTGLQKDVIQKNLRTFPAYRGLYPAIRSFKQDVVVEFEKRYPIERLPLPSSLFSTSGRSRSLIASIHADTRSEEGSFYDKCNRAVLSFSRLLSYMEAQANEFMTQHVSIFKLNVSIQGSFPIENQISGMPYVNVLNSRFCYGRLLTLRQELRNALMAHYSSNPMPRREDHYCAGVHELGTLITSATGVTLDTRRHGLIVVCFRETTPIFVKRKDIEVTRRRLGQFIEKLLTLKPGQTMFLCEFSLLTRLHVGLIHFIKYRFHRVEVTYLFERRMLGVLLHGFKGFYRRDDTVKNQLLDLKTSLETNDPDNMILELFPMKRLYTHPSAKQFIMYNILNVTQIMSQCVTDAKKSLHVQSG